MSTYSKKKDFKDLSLLDAFLFALATENPQNAELIEPNTYEEKYLEKRSRYYLSLTDTKYLGKIKEYKDLPDFVSIWILPYAPFGDIRMVYTVKNMGVENPKLVNTI